MFLLCNTLHTSSLEQAWGEDEQRGVGQLLEEDGREMKLSLELQERAMSMTVRETEFPGYIWCPRLQVERCFVTFVPSLLVIYPIFTSS